MAASGIRGHLRESRESVKGLYLHNYKPLCPLHLQKPNTSTSVLPTWYVLAKDLVLYVIFFP